VVTWLLWALKTAVPPQRAVTVLALPDMSAVLPSLAVTVLLLSDRKVARLLLVTLTVLKWPPTLLALLPFRAMAVPPISKLRPEIAWLLLSAIAVFSSNPPAPSKLLLLAMARFPNPIPSATAWLLSDAMARLRCGAAAGFHQHDSGKRDRPVTRVGRRRGCVRQCGCCPNAERQEGNASADCDGSQYCALHSSFLRLDATHGFCRSGPSLGSQQQSSRPTDEPP
jgi:hypothetical protein